MVKARILILLFVCIICVGIVAALHQMSEMPNRNDNGFNRKFTLIEPRQVNHITLDMNSYYICSFEDSVIILSNYTSPLSYFTYHLRSKQFKKGEIKIAGELLFRKASFSKFFSGTEITVMDGKNGMAFRGENNNRFLTKVSTGLPVFDACVSLNEGAVIRRFENKFDQLILEKINYKNPDEKKLFIPEDVNDGIFSADGQLAYQNKDSVFVYAFYYKNKFIVLDTNLNLKSYFNTIDTFSVPEISIDSVNSSGKIKMNKPPTMVNRYVGIRGNFLYIHSALRADNEEISRFNQNQVIDVYRIANGKYMFSFYLPYFRNIRPGGFQVYDNRIAVLYQEHLVIFSFNAATAALSSVSHNR